MIPIDKKRETGLTAEKELIETEKFTKIDAVDSEMAESKDNFRKMKVLLHTLFYISSSYATLFQERKETRVFSKTLHFLEIYFLDSYKNFATCAVKI